MLIEDKNGKQYFILFQHPCGDYFVRMLNSQQTRWIKYTNHFYRRIKC